LEKGEKEFERLFEEIRRYGYNSEKLTRKHKKIIQLLESHGYSLSSSLLRELGSNILELTRFRGHLILREKGVHDVKKRSKVPTRVSPANGGTCEVGKECRIIGTGVRTV
jgi:hypothetical protein